MTDSFVELLRARLRVLHSTARLGQFVAVGFVGATVDNLTLFTLVEFTVLGPVLAKLIAWELGIVVIFAINERWTFSDYGGDGARALGYRFLRSNAVRVGGFLVTLTVLAALVYGFGVWYLAANVIGIAVGFVVNYTLESLYTWKIHRDHR